jgi:VCBS repeat-containing protein
MEAALSAGARRLTEKTLFFVVEGTGGGLSRAVITDNKGNAVLGDVHLPAGTYNVTAYFSGQITLHSGVELNLDDERYEPTTATGTLTLLNTPPQAVSDAYSTDEDVVLVINAPGVLANDSDINGDVLEAVLDAAPAHGTVTLNTDGSFSYTPAPNFSGSDSFSYRAADGLDTSDTVIVTITVNELNDPPVVQDDAYSVDEDTILTVSAPGVLGNDSDEEEMPLTAVLQATTTNGTLIFNSDGSFSYTPAANFNGSDSFTYVANDGHSNSAVATVMITVNGVNDAPVAVDDNAVTAEDTAVDITVLSNDSDVDGDALTVGSVTTAANGIVSHDGAVVTYMPAADYCGSDSFGYTVVDGNGGSDTAVVTITTNCVNDAPVALDDAYSVVNNATLAVAAPGVLGNDGDVDSAGLTAVLNTPPTNGTLTFNNDGSFSYTPDAGFIGVDTFTYIANDGALNSSPATVTITVNPSNTAPGCSQATTSITFIWPPDKTFVSVNILNVTDADGDPITITIDAIRQDERTGHGNNSPDGYGIGTDTAYVRAERAGNSNGRVYHITFTATDGHGGACTATIRLPVVTHDQSGDIDAYDEGPLYDATVEN